jgi:phosphoenolpyruvate carboxylase
VPLVETVDDLMRAEAIFKALLDIPQYREQLKLRDDHLEVMLGYSDSNKGDGTLAARAILFDVTKKLAALEAKYPGLKLTFFHGTGGTPPRGGWTIAQTLEAQPEQSLRTGRIRKTIQGETIENDFGTSERALRSFDQLVSGVLKAAHPEIFPSPTAKQEHRLALDALVQHARRSYQSLLNMPDFEPSFFAMTAYAEVGSKLNLGSRKGARGAAQTIEDMRAIPWVFAWNQIELKLPTWYGVGSALRDFIRVDQPQQQAGFADDAHSEAVQPESAARIAKLETLREMYRDLPMFTHLLDNVALTLHSVDLDIARDYVAMIDDDLAASGKAIMKQITKEHNVLQAMLWLVGVDAIAGESAVPTPGRGHRHLPLLHILQQENVKTKGELESRRLHALAIATVHKQTA